MIAKFLNVDKIWHRGVINTCKKGLTPMEIHADMVDTLGDDTPGLSTVQKWYAEFKGEQNRSLENRFTQILVSSIFAKKFFSLSLQK